MLLSPRCALPLPAPPVLVPLSFLGSCIMECRRWIVRLTRGRHGSHAQDLLHFGSDVGLGDQNFGVVTLVVGALLGLPHELDAQMDLAAAALHMADPALQQTRDVLKIVHVDVVHLKTATTRMPPGQGQWGFLGGGGGQTRRPRQTGALGAVGA